MLPIVYSTQKITFVICIDNYCNVMYTLAYCFIFNSDKANSANICGYDEQVANVNKHITMTKNNLHLLESGVIS